LEIGRLMAKEEHLAILKQGVDEWNRWRKENPEIKPDLSEENLCGTDLRGANLCEANMYGINLSDADFSSANLCEADITRANLMGVNLVDANLRGADLRGAYLREANLRDANLSDTNLSDANLSGANLHKANLNWANLNWTNISDADLSEAILGEAIFHEANISNTDFDKATIGFTIIAKTDLSKATHLESMKHWAPSTIGIDTIYISKGKIPTIFLRGAGVPEYLIEYMHSLTGEALQFYSCFISYSSKDQEFAERLYKDLQAGGVRCWFAQENMKIGDTLRQRIDEQIPMHDKLLLIISESAIKSQYIEQEVETALRNERKLDRTIIFPITLDNAVTKIETGWPALIRNTRHIGDFRKWKDHDSYQKAFDRLLRDLKAEGKKKE
jgi:hypothetical protein